MRLYRLALVSTVVILVAFFFDGLGLLFGENFLTAEEVAFFVRVDETRQEAVLRLDILTERLGDVKVGRVTAAEFGSLNDIREMRVWARGTADGFSAQGKLGRSYSWLANRYALVFYRLDEAIAATVTAIGSGSDPILFQFGNKSFRSVREAYKAADNCRTNFTVTAFPLLPLLRQLCG